MKVLISGGNGMIGTALTKALLSKGHHVWILTRAKDAAHLAPRAQAAGWDGQTGAGWGELAGQMDAVVNLAGERLSKWPWTENLKQRFWNSRVDAGHALVEAYIVPQRLLDLGFSFQYGNVQAALSSLLGN